jgi:hypothetical protein
MFLTDVKARHVSFIVGSYIVMAGFVHRTSFGAVSHKPKAVPARVCECYGLTRDESAFVEGRNDRRG